MVIYSMLVCPDVDGVDTALSARPSGQEDLHPMPGPLHFKILPSVNTSQKRKEEAT